MEGELRRMSMNEVTIKRQQNKIGLLEGLLLAEQEDCQLQRKNKIANWERVQNLERYVNQLHHQIEELYLVRIEPDKMLCMIERLRQRIKAAESD